ncbi:MAG: DUF4386 family protein [Anaerolineae bacterium]|nr:DUF4386 family protein [Anaerolineae bacterium]
MDESTVELHWKKFFKFGAWAAVIGVLVGVVESGIQFFPGAAGGDAVTAADWFALIQDHWFIGLRNLGLLNILFALTGIPFMIALYGAHRKSQPTFALQAMIVSMIGAGVFLATNRAFAMLSLSQQYAAATSEAQRAALVAAGQSMLVVGQSHTPGTFLAFLMTEGAGLLMSIVMLRGGVFSKGNAIAGIVAFGGLLLYDISYSFVPALQDLAMIFVFLAGAASIVWQIMAALKLFQLGKADVT